MVRFFTLFLVLVALLATLAPARAVEVLNEDGKYDGLYDATVRNRTQDVVTEGVEVDVEGRYIEIRLPSGPRRLKISEMFDRRYQLEITARDHQTGDLYVIQIKT